jgi:hypothetical protein
MDKVLIFEPFAGIWPHSIQELRLALSIKEDFELSYLSCGGMFEDFCTVRESRGRGVSDFATRAKIDCIDCKFSASLVGSSLVGTRSSRREWLSKYVKTSDSVEVERILNGIDFSNIQASIDLDFMGVPIVRVSLYETLLKFKKRTLDLNFEQIEFQKIQTKNVIRTVIAAQRYFEKHSFDALVIYSPQYAINHAVAAVAKRYGSRTVFVEGSSSNAERSRKVRVWDWGVYGLSNPALEKWTSESPNSIGSQSLKSSDEHLIATTKGFSHSVYSNTSRRPKSIREFLDIPPSNLVLVCALSSYDEAFAAYTIGAFPKKRFISGVFVNQFEWVKETINWAAMHPELFLVIRLHPRDLPNRRDPMRSQQVDEWESILIDLPPNVRVDHPSDQIPITSYWGQANIWITGWSSTAIEAMANGIPVLTYDYEMASFPRSIHRSGSSRKEYIGNLDFMTRNTIDSQEVQANAKAWLSYNFDAGTVSIAPLRSRLVRRILQNPLLSRINTGLYLVLFPIYRTLSAAKALLGTQVSSKSRSKLRDILAGQATDLY